MTIRTIEVLMQRTRILLTFFTAFLLTMTLQAQTGGKISGKITDSRTSEPLPGANVVIEGTTIGSSSDLEGDYVILNVPPAVYTVNISFIGYKRSQVRDVRVSSGFTVKLDIALEEGEIELEPVIVQGERTPLIRKDLTNPVASISGESFNELPVTDISEVIGLQAGTTVDDDGSIHIRGGYGNEIAYTVNGLNINNPYGNSRSVGLATNAVQEVSVSSGTFTAEYGQALSGVVNYVTKEGGSKLSGGVKYLTGDRVSSRTDLFPEVNKFHLSNVSRFELTLGGPIIQNTFSFFVSGVYGYSNGTIYGTRIYRPEDSYLSREGFPTTDPRRGSSTAPYYFAPFSHPTSDLVGGPSGDGETVPLTWSQSYNVQGNLLYRLSRDLRFKYELVHDRSLGPSGSGNSSAFANRFKPDGRRLAKGEGYTQTVELTHVLSDRAFYTVKASHISDRTTSRAYDKISDPRYLPPFYLRSIGNTSFLTGGVDLFRFKQKTETIVGKIDAVVQAEIHELKGGLEVRSHSVSAESYTLQFIDPAFPNIDPSPQNQLSGLYDFRPFVPTVDGGYLYYTFHPLEISAYVQDKIELFQTIILNLGLRYEYFDPAADYNPLLSEELSNQTSIFVDKNKKKASVKQSLMPRVSFSFPITDKGTIRFSYGHFQQNGSLSSLYANPNFRAPLGTSPTFGNPNVNAQKSVQYELGLQQGLTENLKFDLTAYYKDVRDYIFTQTIITARGDLQYGVLTNLSYANTRGVSFSLVKRRSPGDLLSATLDYTFQVSEGTRTSPSDEIFFNEEKGKLSETYLVPFGFDRSHTITSTVTVSEPSDWNISLIGYIRTGTPYTPSFPSSVVPIVFVQNSDRQPVQWNTDLRIEKYFKFGEIDYSVYLIVDNLFDTQNEQFVYSNSGRALYNIEETINPFQFADLRNRIARADPGMIPLSSVDQYYARPENVSSPRLVRLGVSVKF